MQKQPIHQNALPSRTGLNGNAVALSIFDSNNNFKAKQLGPLKCPVSNGADRVGRDPSATTPR